MTNWGRKMFVTPGVVVDGKLVTNDLVDDQSRRFASCSATRTTTIGKTKKCSFRKIRSAIRSTVGTRGTCTRCRHPKKRDFANEYSWVMSPRWFDGKDYLALDTGGGPIARLWSTALSGLVDMGGYIKATGTSVEINLPKSALSGPVSFEWKIPKWSNTLERNRARTYFQAYAAAAALHFLDKAFEELNAGRTRSWEPFTVPKEAIGCGFTEAVRGVLSHHMVIRDGKIANYHPWPPTPWNGNPRDIYGTPGPVRRRRAEYADLSKKTVRRTSRGSISCARCAASIRVCRAAFTCIWVKGRGSKRYTRRSRRSGRRVQR